MIGNAEIRDSARPQATSPRAPISASTKYDPKQMPAISARTTLRRWSDPATPPPSSSRDASTTPATASASPTDRTSPGLSPSSTPISTGSATPVEAIGATMLIVPIASAR